MRIVKSQIETKTKRFSNNFNYLAIESLGTAKYFLAFNLYFCLLYVYIFGKRFEPGIHSLVFYRHRYVFDILLNGLKHKNNQSII